MGRKHRFESNFNIRMRADVVARLDAEAEKHGHDRSEEVRQRIDESFAQEAVGPEERDVTTVSTTNVGGDLWVRVQTFRK